MHQKSKALIKPYGYMGDHLFASSVAQKLKEEKQFDIVDIACGIRQVEKLLNLNPYVDNVITLAYPTQSPLHGVNVTGYDKQFELTETRKNVPPPLQFQRECGVKHPDTKFKIWTDPSLDEKVAETYPYPFIAVMQRESWRAKAYGFTLEEYAKGIDVPLKGYGGRLRNINHIVSALTERFTLIEVGLIPTAATLDVAKRWGTQSDIYRSLTWDASVIKRADYFIGAEGGLANVACGVGTKTILTGDFVHQLYGWNGVIKKVDNPELGPRFYFPDAGHIDLNPYLTDDVVIEEMKAILDGAKTAKDYTYEWTSREYGRIQSSV